MKSKYLIELHTPKMSSETFETELEEFAAQYEEVMEAGFVISVPDNPMGCWLKSLKS